MASREDAINKLWKSLLTDHPGRQIDVGETCTGLIDETWKPDCEKDTIIRPPKQTPVGYKLRLQQTQLTILSRDAQGKFHRQTLVEVRFAKAPEAEAI